ncbi:MAG: hypothetical protein WD873_01315, partial [Candidatus Hydrogenedentales bacterium]
MSFNQRTKYARYMICMATACLFTGCAYLGGNFREVAPGAVYRSGQLHPQALERKLEQHNIRTVVNLRAAGPGERWYEDEQAVCAAQGAAHYSLGWSMHALPPPESLARLIDLYESDAGPILIHCHGGVHRAAIGAAVYVLLQGGSVETARQQLGSHFNDAAIGQLLDLYEADGGNFELWAREVYPRVYKVYIAN